MAKKDAQPNEGNAAPADGAEAPKVEKPATKIQFTFVKDPAWVGNYPSPFHLCFSMDRSKMFVSVLSPKPSPISPTRLTGATRCTSRAERTTRAGR